MEEIFPHPLSALSKEIENHTKRDKNELNED